MNDFLKTLKRLSYKCIQYKHIRKKKRLAKSLRQQNALHSDRKLFSGHQGMLTTALTLGHKVQKGYCYLRKIYLRIYLRKISIIWLQTVKNQQQNIHLLK